MRSITIFGRQIEGFLLDLDGALLDGNVIRGDAEEFLATLRHDGIPFVCVSNRSSDDAATICEMLNLHERLVEPNQILTPVQVAPVFLNARYNGYLRGVFGTDAFKGSLEDAGIFQQIRIGADHQDWSEIFLLGNIPGFTLATVDYMCSIIERSIHESRRDRRHILVATNPDIGHPGFGGVFVSDTGTIVQEIRKRIDIPVDFIGKPGNTLFQLGTMRIGAPAHTLAMVGDNPETDIYGARRNGLFSILYQPDMNKAMQLCNECTPDVICSNYLSLLDNT